MARQSEDFPAGLRVPDLYRRVPVRGEALAVGAEGGTVETAVTLSEHESRLASPHLVDTQACRCPVAGEEQASHRQPPAVGAERRSETPSRRKEAAGLLVRRQVPDLGGAVPTRRGEAPAARAEGHAATDPAMAAERGQFLAGRCLP